MYKQEGYDLVGAAIAVYNEIGHGFLEEVYQECLAIELEMRGIPFENQPKLELKYKDRKLDKYYKPDFYVFSGIVVELKAVKQLAADHESQLFNYLKATDKSVGYLINFGNPKELGWKRFIMDH